MRNSKKQKHTFFGNTDTDKRMFSDPSYFAPKKRVVFSRMTLIFFPYSKIPKIKDKKIHQNSTNWARCIKIEHKHPRLVCKIRWNFELSTIIISMFFMTLFKNNLKNAFFNFHGTPQFPMYNLVPNNYSYQKPL